LEKVLIEFGLVTFGDVTEGADGRPLPHADVIRNVISEAILAEKVGVSAFGIGEHHRSDFAISAPDIVLAAIAERTSRIKLGSAVTVLSSEDPIRVYQRFATLSAVTGGRTEVILGRGAFRESFPLFGYSLSDYDALFTEKLGLFVACLRRDKVTWQGSFRPPLTQVKVYPDIGREPFKTWIAVSNSPDSLLRIAQHDLSLMLGVIGGEPTRFRPFVDLYAAACEKLQRQPRTIGVHANGYIAATDSAAISDFWPHYKSMRDRHGALFGWKPIERHIFEREVEDGALFVGSPETVARKIAKTAAALQISRFDLKYSTGTLPHQNLLESIRLYGEQVVPLVQRLLPKGVACRDFAGSA
jgi:probable LLM family oxidoreductase